MAATALGRLVTAARTSPPTTISDNPKWIPSEDAPRSIATLAHHHRTSDTTATSDIHRRTTRWTNRDDKL